jgi:homoserine O-succinyltransferase/O-acetyltransferase
VEPYWKAGALERRRVRSSLVGFGQDRRRLKVGLVNNMPDAALVATERQFRALLDAAAPERLVELHLFHAPAISRGAEAADRLRARYRPATEVERADLDALIVTGAEPRAADLRVEPFWPALTRLADWAAEAELPTLWSCLAAHAAVLHLDGIGRRRLPRKCSGLYARLPAAPDDALLAGCPGVAVTPHSRSNALDEAELRAAGYLVLTRSPEAGVDSFVRRGRGGLMLFLQGHPEYEPNALALEFRRDLKRYLDGAADGLPALPAGVFGEGTAHRLEALLDAARRDRRPGLMALWPPPAELVLAADTWRAPAARLYRNWLASSYPETRQGGAELRLSA